MSIKYSKIFIIFLLTILTECYTLFNMNIDKDIPVPNQIRGRTPKYNFASMRIKESFFTPGDSSVQVSILTCAKRYGSKTNKKFVTKKAIVTTNKGRPSEKTVHGYRCWRVK